MTAAPRTTALVRERLLRRGDGARVCLLAAPAGFGKSVLLRQITSRLGIGGVFAPAREWIRDAALLDAVDASHRRRYIAVDDFHELEGTQAGAALLELFERGPEGLTVLLASRTPPAANLSRLRASGDLWDVAADDLRFRSWEVEDLYRDVYREPLTREEVTTLTRRTEGWAACLQLFHLATSGLGPRPRAAALAGMRAMSPVTAAYLVQNVLDSLPEPLRELLVRTAPLPALTVASCDSMTGRTGSRELLEELERRGLVQRSLDGRTWRCRAILRAHLDAALDEDAGAPRRWLAAAALLEEQGLAADAVRAYSRGGERGAAARLLAVHGPEIAGSPAAVVDLEAEVPPDDPWLLLAAARWQRAQGCVDEALAAYRRAEESFGGGRGRVLCSDERRSLSCWVDPLDRSLGDWSGALRDSLSARRPRALESESDLARGLAELARGEVHRAIGTLSAVAGGADATPATALAARVGIAAALLLRGDGRGKDLAEQAAEEAEMLDLPWMVRLAYAVTRLGANSSTRLPEFDDPVGTLLARLLAGLGSLWGRDPAVDAFEEALAIAQRLGLTALEAWAWAGRALASVRCGDEEARAVAARAEAFARVTGACGPRALALLALAEASADASTEAAAAVMSQGCGTALPRPPAPATRVRCFGGLVVESNGTAVSLDGLRPKARQLLRLLLLHAPQPAHREVLVEALWPHLPPRSAASSLHVAVSSLRGALEDVEGLDVGRDGDAYVLDLAPDVDVDLLHFRAATTGTPDAASARAAFGLYRGDVFPEEGPAEWVVEHREHLRDRAAHAAVRVAELVLVDDPAAAAAVCERGLEIDRHVDALWRILVDACQRAGDHAAARRAAARYDAILEDLGVALSER